MKGFFRWFNSRTKMKRWLFLILVGIVLLCYGISKLIVLEVIPSTTEIVKIAVSISIGMVLIIISIVHMQKRNLELLIEESDTRSETNNVNRLIFNKKVYNQGPKIVVIGGGYGLNTVLRGLKNYTDNITAIVTVSDYGETPTDSRTALKVLPMDDITQSLAALAYNEDEMRGLLDYKFDEGRLNNLKFSDIYFLAMNNIKKNFTKSIENSTNVLNITGRVLPVTLDAINICAELDDGTIIENRDDIPEIVQNTSKKITRVFINPTNTRPAPGVLEAIQEADAIIIGPGSLYTNVIPNLLVRGIAREIKEAKGMKIYVSNIMTEYGQTDEYTLSDHIKAIQEYIGEGIIDYCIYDTGEIVPEYIKMYNYEKNSDVVLADTQKTKELGVKLVQRNLSKIEDDRIRHDSDVIASTIIQLVCDELEFKDMENDSQYMTINSKLIETNRQKRRRERREKKFKKSGKKMYERDKNFKSRFKDKYNNRVESIKESDNETLDTKRLKVEKITEQELLKHVNEIGIGKQYQSKDEDNK